MSQPKTTSQKPKPPSTAEKNLSLWMYLPRSTPSMSETATFTLGLAELRIASRTDAWSVTCFSALVIPVGSLRARILGERAALRDLQIMRQGACGGARDLGDVVPPAHAQRAVAVRLRQELARLSLGEDPALEGEAALRVLGEALVVVGLEGA